MAPAVKELDLRGLKCPLPVLHTRRALKSLAPGDVVEVRSTDPLAGIDIPHLAASDGHGVETLRDVPGVARFRITKGGAEPDASRVETL